MDSFEKYKHLYKEPVRITSDTYVFTERLETRSRNFNWNIKPHIHPGIHQLFFIKSGSLFLQTSKKREKISSPCLLIVPSSVVHGFRFTEDSHGNILSLNSTISDDIITQYETLASLFTELEIISLAEDGNDLSRISTLFKFMDDELNHLLPEKHGMLQSLLQELFIVVFRLWRNKQAKKTNSADYRSLRYFREFQQLMRNSDNKTSVKQIAKKIGITSVHLNRICNQTADKPASKLIHEHIITKAKNYLIYTSFSFSEIAYSLNFEYSNYFSRFFKNHTGLSPAEFRTQWIKSELNK